MTFVYWYMLGCLLVAAATAAGAVVLRTSHGMRPSEVALLALGAGATWPLLAVAFVQILGLGGLIGLGKAFGRTLRRVGADAKPADTSVPQGVKVPEEVEVPMAQHVELALST